MLDNINKDIRNGFVTIVVLNDGETYTDIHNCSICVVPLADYERVVKMGGDARDFKPVVEIGLSNISVPLEYL
jgi:hypothetical protein